MNLLPVKEPMCAEFGPIALTTRQYFMAVFCPNIVRTRYRPIGRLYRPCFKIAPQKFFI